MKRPIKPTLSLALQRAQVALHEATLEVGRLQELESRVRRALQSWRRGGLQDEIIITESPDLWSILPVK